MRIALDTMQYQGSIVACLANIGSNEGVRALYFGLPATIAGIIPFSSMKLATCVRHAAAAPSPNPTFSGEVAYRVGHRGKRCRAWKLICRL